MLFIKATKGSQPLSSRYFLSALASGISTKHSQIWVRIVDYSIYKQGYPHRPRGLPLSPKSLTDKQFQYLLKIQMEMSQSMPPSRLRLLLKNKNSLSERVLSPLVWRLQFDGTSTHSRKHQLRLLLWDYGYHLTTPNKILLSNAKKAAKKKGFRYVWVKHAKTFVRRDNVSPISTIKTERDVLKVV